jgi:glycosyltransferase involved in cell wall biosynthesis
MGGFSCRPTPCTVGYLTHGARNIGGGEYLLAALVRMLDRDLFRPVLFFAQRNEIIDRLEAEGVATVPIELNRAMISLFRDEIARSPAHLIRFLPAVGKNILVVRRAILSQGIELLHPHDNLSKILGGAAAATTGIPTVAHCHDLLGQGFVDRLLLQAQRFLMDRVIAVSGSVRDRLARGGMKPSRIRTIPNGIDLSRFVPGRSNLRRAGFSIPETHRVLGVIGMFDPVKGHVFLLRAIKRLLESGTGDLTCLVVGAGRQEAELKAFVDQAGINGQVRFLGYRRDVPDLLGLMDLLVIPSLRESFGLVAIEAMAMKVPVIASRIGGLEEIVEHGKTGMLVPPGDPAALAAAIRELADNPATRRRMGEAGRRRAVESFGIETTVRKTEELYLEILGRKAHPAPRAQNRDVHEHRAQRR